MADAATGDVREVMTETTPTFFESGIDKINWRYLPASNEILWYSERDNWGNLYLYDLASGQLKNQITHGPGNAAQVLYVDQKDRTIYFVGVGKEAGPRSLLPVSLQRGIRWKRSSPAYSGERGSRNRDVTGRKLLRRLLLDGDAAGSHSGPRSHRKSCDGCCPSGYFAPSCRRMGASCPHQRDTPRLHVPGDLAGGRRAERRSTAAGSRWSPALPANVERAGVTRRAVSAGSRGAGQAQLRAADPVLGDRSTQSSPLGDSQEGQEQAKIESNGIATARWCARSQASRRRCSPRGRCYAAPDGAASAGARRRRRRS